MVPQVRAVTKRAAMYCRVSTDDQAEHGYSLEDQEKKGHAQAVAKDWEVVEDRYVDEGVSGTTGNRPALKRLLRDIKAGKVDVVIVTKMDRLARNLKLLLELWDTIEAHGATVLVIAESIDTSTSVGRLIRNVLGSIAEFERDTILERTRTGHVAKVKRGHAWRSRPPYGYRYIPGKAGQGRSDPGRFEIIPEEESVVRRMFESVAGGKSATAVAVALTAEGIPTQRGAQKWSGSTVQAIMHNPIYRGCIAWGRKTNVKVEDSETKDIKRFQRKQIDAAAVIYADNDAPNVPAIVSAELQTQARAQLERNYMFAKRNTKREYLLAGVMLCGAIMEDGTICGHALTGGNGRRYQCNHHASTGQRKSHSVALRPVEDAVWMALCKMLADPSTVLDQARALADASTDVAQEMDAQITRLDKEMAKQDAKQAALLDLYLDKGVSREQYTAKVAAMETQQQELRTQIAALEARRDTARDKMLPVSEIEAACAWVARGIDALTFEERQHIVRSLCTRVIATKDSVSIEGYLPALNMTIDTAYGAKDTIATTSLA